MGFSWATVLAAPAPDAGGLGGIETVRMAAGGPATRPALRRRPPEALRQIGRHRLADRRMAEQLETEVAQEMPGGAPALQTGPKWERKSECFIGMPRL
jgi:hypothetical protein